MTQPVECRSDSSYAEKPAALTWAGQRLEIGEIMAEWLTPDEKHFRVRTRDGQTFELTYRLAANEWQIQQL